MLRSRNLIYVGACALMIIAVAAFLIPHESGVSRAQQDVVISDQSTTQGAEDLPSARPVMELPGVVSRGNPLALTGGDESGPSNMPTVVVEVDADQLDDGVPEMPTIAEESLVPEGAWQQGLAASSIAPYEGEGNLFEIKEVPVSNGIPYPDEAYGPDGQLTDEYQILAGDAILTQGLLPLPPESSGTSDLPGSPELPGLGNESTEVGIGQIPTETD